MSTRTHLMQETENHLNALINQWAARCRLRRVVLYMPRIVLATTVVGMITSLLLMNARALGVTGMLIVTAIAMSGTFVLITSALGLWSKRGYEAARQFELLFGLQERISTALELLDGRISTVPEIAQYQLEDAYEVAKTVDPRKQMPLKIKWLEWAGAVFSIALLIVTIALSVYQLSRAVTTVSTQTQGAINNAADTTRDITEDIATDTNLSEEQRSALLESAEVTLDELESPDPSAEEAFVAMSDLESDLREQVEALREEAENSESSLEDAANTLGNQGTPSDQSEQNAGESLADALEQQAQDAQQMNQSEQGDLAQQLEDAADAVRDENPDLAEQLDNAADALQNGDSQQFAESMQDAGEQSRSSSESNQSQQQSADTLEQAADQAQQAANEISQSEQQANQDGDQQQSESQQSESGQQQQSQQQQQQQGQQEGQQQQGGQQEGEGQNPDAQSQGEDGQQVQSEEGQASSQQAGTDASSSSEEASEGEDGGGAGSAGDGDGPDQQGITAVGEQELGGNTQNDGGESEFDSIFAPSEQNIQQGNTNIVLETDATNEQVREGDFQENPDGESIVPYNEVFSSYADSASSALENGYVPLGVRDVVRDYFTSLEPTGRNAGDE